MDLSCSTEVYIFQVTERNARFIITILENIGSHLQVQVNASKQGAFEKQEFEINCSIAHAAYDFC